MYSPLSNSYVIYGFYKLKKLLSLLVVLVLLVLIQRIIAQTALYDWLTYSQFSAAIYGCLYGFVSEICKIMN